MFAAKKLYLYHSDVFQYQPQSLWFFLWFILYWVHQVFTVFV